MYVAVLAREEGVVLSFACVDSSPPPQQPQQRSPPRALQMPQQMPQLKSPPRGLPRLPQMSPLNKCQLKHLLRGLQRSRLNHQQTLQLNPLKPPRNSLPSVHHQRDAMCAMHAVTDLLWSQCAHLATKRSAQRRLQPLQAQQQQGVWGAASPTSAVRFIYHTWR